MKIGVADIKSLYTNITHELGIKAMQFWITKLKKKILLLQRFPKHFIMETKGTVMRTLFAAVYANLVVVFIEDSMFNKLPEIYPKYIV